MDEALQKDLIRFISDQGMECPTFIAPIFDRVMVAVPLVAVERAHDFRDLLADHKITLVLDYKSNQRFSALPPLRKVFLGVDGLERSTVFCFGFVSVGCQLAGAVWARASTRPTGARSCTAKTKDHVERDCIVIWAVKHLRRDPDYWKERRRTT